jgi:hypothetical protein
VEDKPSKTPYLRFGEIETLIMGPAVEIVGNAMALLQLRRQIDRTLKDVDRYPLDEGIALPRTRVNRVGAVVAPALANASFALEP